MLAGSEAYPPPPRKKKNVENVENLVCTRGICTKERQHRLITDTCTINRYILMFYTEFFLI